MLKYLGLLLASAIMILIEVPSLWKRKRIWDLWVFSTLLFFGIVLVMMRFLNLHIPNPVNGINEVLGPLAEAVFQNLKGGN
ncbi:hypothetical protein [Paenibacillus glycanilyticus]|uniref:Uncharacterized protein n=1 Tax=Paenibacillus glycanilyticus TaxID=126569 RepID=A0ABQ6GB78_9BACL|nr:hypothetical protein [Paenibacillus glycanilyticus]GLX67478.1 hypothetical protein MU1_18230 [Paenibacillus glycanilyticus]